MTEAQTIQPSTDDTKLGEYGYARLEHDAYWTEPWVTEALLKVWQPAGAVWEPACGNGAIVKVLEAAGHRVVASDIRFWGVPATYNFDFVAWRGKGQDASFLLDRLEDLAAGTIVTNVPYKLASPFIENGLEWIKARSGQMALLFTSDFDQAQRRERFFDQEPMFACEVKLTRRPHWVGRTGGGRRNYAWYIWDARHEGPPTKAYSR